MRLRAFTVSVVVFFLWSAVIPAQDAGSDLDLVVRAPVLQRKALIQAVLDRNPGIEAARYARAVLREHETSVGSLEDPMLSYSLAPLSIGSDEVRYGQVIRVSQRFPSRGTLGLRSRQAGAMAEASHEELERLRLDLAAAASLLFDEYFVLHRSIEINEEHARLVAGFRRIVIARYAAGAGPQQDPIQAEVELAHLAHHKVMLESSVATVVARINTLMHRPPEDPLPPPPAKLPDPFLVPAARLQEKALSGSPGLRAHQAAIRAGTATVELEEKGAKPQFEVMASYDSMWAATEHQWMVGAAINLPVQRKRTRANVARARARVAQLESEQQVLENQVRSEIQQIYIRLREAYHVVGLYRDRLLPAAADHVQAALSGYETNQNSFLVLIEAEKNQRSIQLQYQESIAAFHQRRAELDRALGRMPMEWDFADPEEVNP